MASIRLNIENEHISVDKCFACTYVTMRYT